MILSLRTMCVTRYADVKTVTRRVTPVVYYVCPKCRKHCDVDFLVGGGPVSCEILCPDCGITRLNNDLTGSEPAFVIEGTGEKYSQRMNLDDAEARAKAVKGDRMEEPIALAEAAWEAYLCITKQSLPYWDDAVDCFARCKRMDREHVRRMVSLILKFSGLTGDRGMREITLDACMKAADLIGKPETAEECMLWMDIFNLRCSLGVLDDGDAALPGIARDAYQALSEQEKAECPAFPALWPLIMYRCSTEYWEAGGIDCDEEGLNAFESELWGKAVEETEKMLRSGHPMTTRIFRLITDKAGHEMLSPCVHPVLEQLEALAELSGDYTDAFRARIELIEVLKTVWGDPIMPYFALAPLRFRWTPEAFAKLEDAIRKLERYRDPEIVGSMLTDAYFLFYKHEGASEVKKNCTQMMDAMSDRHLDPGSKPFMAEIDLSGLDDIMYEPAPMDWSRAKPKGKSKKERVAEKRKAHIAKRK